MTDATVFDFGDGNGLVPAKRHKNPDGAVGGWVADTAQVYGGSGIASGQAAGYSWTAYYAGEGMGGRSILMLQFGCERHPASAWARLSPALARKHRPEQAREFAATTRALASAVKVLVRRPGRG